MNMAMADACVLARAFVQYYEHGGRKWVDTLSSYTAHCLQHIWNAQEFSTFMTRLMHLFPTSTDDNLDNYQSQCDQYLQEARQRMVCNSVELQRFIAEKFVNGM
jgi:p-hydroxybenzoate 3-monooxygenase